MFAQVSGRCRAISCRSFVRHCLFRLVARCRSSFFFWRQDTSLCRSRPVHGLSRDGVCAGGFTGLLRFVLFYFLFLLLLLFMCPCFRTNLSFCCRLCDSCERGYCWPGTCVLVETVSRCNRFDIRHIAAVQFIKKYKNNYEKATEQVISEMAVLRGRMRTPRSAKQCLACVTSSRDLRAAIVSDLPAGINKAGYRFRALRHAGCSVY